MTSLVPSGKVPSTCTSSIISGTPRATSSRPSSWRPRSISSATDRPSRMNSSSCVGDQRDRLRIVQAQAAREPFLGEEAGLVQQQLVDFARRQMHRFTTSVPMDRRSTTRKYRTDSRGSRPRPARPSGRRCAAGSRRPSAELPQRAGRHRRSTGRSATAAVARAAASRQRGPAITTVLSTSKRPMRRARSPSAGERRSASSRIGRPS